MICFFLIFDLCFLEILTGKKKNNLNHVSSAFPRGSANTISYDWLPQLRGEGKETQKQSVKVFNSFQTQF